VFIAVDPSAEVLVGTQDKSRPFTASGDSAVKNASFHQELLLHVAEICDLAPVTLVKGLESAKVGKKEVEDGAGLVRSSPTREDVATQVARDADLGAENDVLILVG
jgi:hypothetical protein